MNNVNKRYVLTHIDRNGMRTLMDPAQGRFTYPTRQEAEQRLDAVKAFNSEDRLHGMFGFPLEVREVECWPGHNDPKTVWFD